MDNKITRGVSEGNTIDGLAPQIEDSGDATYCMIVTLAFGHGTTNGKIRPVSKVERQQIVKKEIQRILANWTNIYDVDVFDVEEDEVLTK